MKRVSTSDNAMVIAIIVGTALVVSSALVAVQKGYITLEGLEDLVPQIEYKNGEQIQTIDGKRFVRTHRGDGTYYLIPLDSHQPEKGQQ